MYATILMLSMTGTADVPQAFFAPRGGCAGTRAVATAPRAGCQGVASRTITRSRTKTVATAVKAPVAVVAAPVAPPVVVKEAPKAPVVVVVPQVPVPMTVAVQADPPVFARVRATVCANGNCGALAPIRRLAFWR